MSDDFQNKIETFSFGAPAAERDAGLQAYFIESTSYRLLEAGRRSIVLGNRGSGKSALFKVLAQRKKQSGEVVIEIAPENYSYEILSQHLKRESQGSWAKQGAYAAAWKYLLYLKVMKELNQGGAALKTGSAKSIYEYLRDNHKNEQQNPVAVLLSYLKRLEGLKIGQYEIGAKSKELTSLYQLDEIAPLFGALDELAQRRHVCIFIDELDRGWDASEDAKAFVAGLVQAGLSINEKHPHIRIYISLRRELYDSIPALYEDAQKYRDVMEFVQWDEDSLLAMIVQRIRHHFGDGTVGPLECWHKLFSETIQYRKSRSFNYIVDRTLYRPRELIHICTSIFEEAKKLNNFPIDYDAISRAEVAYSAERAKDIAAEYRFQYPGLTDVFEAFRGSTFSYTREELDNFCSRIVLGDISVGPVASPWLNNQNPEFLVDVLWRVGFLRAQAVGGVKALRRSGSQYLGSHQVDHLNLEAIPRFTIHQMFRAGLGLKEGRSGSEED